MGEIMAKASLPHPFYLGTWPWVSYPEAKWLLSPGTQSRSPRQPRCLSPEPPTFQWAHRYGCQPGRRERKRQTDTHTHRVPREGSRPNKDLPIPLAGQSDARQTPQYPWETCRLSGCRAGRPQTPISICHWFWELLQAALSPGTSS